ncbi:MAG: DNA alkylation repair protein [Dehalococcoidales bacterium]|nr:DNA alkylation repair protein [Dehalococcoidales bacterium]
MSTGPKKLNEFTNSQREGTTKRGGARKGSGPKKRIPIFGVRESELKDLFKALKKEAKKQGQTWQENFAERLYSEDKNEARAFYKMLTDQIKVQAAEKHVVTENKVEPTIFLPEERPDPSKVVPIHKAA